MSAAADERLGAPDDRLGLFATVALVVGGIVGEDVPLVVELRDGDP